MDVNEKSVREAYGILSGILGIICNLSLFAVKLLIGLSINSIAVITDAFNNFTDLGSSLISIIGAKLSNRPPDDEHPYGHGRFEYIGALIVSFIIFSVGFDLLKNAFDKIVHPDKVLLNPLSMVILSLSVLVKVWMFSYNRYIGKTINSSINRATAYDSLSDVVGTSAVVVATVLGTFVDFPIDGILGVIISLLILYTAFNIAKDTINLILGSTPDPELIKSVNTIVSNGKYVIGTHDLDMHDYGPGRVMASIHAEVPCNINIVEAHSVIDELEEKIEKELGIKIVIHMDPVSSEEALKLVQP